MSQDYEIIRRADYRGRQLWISEGRPVIEPGLKGSSTRNDSSCPHPNLCKVGLFSDWALPVGLSQNIPSSNSALRWQPLGRLRSFITEQEKVTQRGDDKRFYPSLDYNSLFNRYRFKPYKLSNTGTNASPFSSWGILASVFQCLQKSLKRKSLGQVLSTLFCDDFYLF